MIAQEYVSVVTKKENGSYGYESVLKERVAKAEKIAISAGRIALSASDGEPGDYIVELRDDGDRQVSRIRFSVVGSGTVKRALDKNSELAGEARPRRNTTAAKKSRSASPRLMPAAA